MIGSCSACLRHGWFACDSRSSEMRSAPSQPWRLLPAGCHPIYMYLSVYLSPSLPVSLCPPLSPRAHARCSLALVSGLSRGPSAQAVVWPLLPTLLFGCLAVYRLVVDCLVVDCLVVDCLVVDCLVVDCLVVDCLVVDSLDGGCLIVDCLVVDASRGRGACRRRHGCCCPLAVTLRPLMTVVLLAVLLFTVVLSTVLLLIVVVLTVVSVTSVVLTALLLTALFFIVLLLTLLLFTVLLSTALLSTALLLTVLLLTVLSGRDTGATSWRGWCSRRRTPLSSCLRYLSWLLR